MLERSSPDVVTLASLDERPGMDGWMGRRASLATRVQSDSRTAAPLLLLLLQRSLLDLASLLRNSVTHFHFLSLSLSLPRTPVLASCDRSPLHLAVYPAIPLMSYRAVPTPPCHWEMEGGLFALTLSLMSDRDYLLISFAPSTVLSECLSGERERVCVCVCACECGTEVV